MNPNLRAHLLQCGDPEPYLQALVNQPPFDYARLRELDKAIDKLIDNWHRQTNREGVRTYGGLRVLKRTQSRRKYRKAARRIRNQFARLVRLREERAVLWSGRPLITRAYPYSLPPRSVRTTLPS
jgi:hypothetical protein